MGKVREMYGRIRIRIKEKHIQNTVVGLLKVYSSKYSPPLSARLENGGHFEKSGDWI
jgi:hypothetical protein